MRVYRYERNGRGPYTVNQEPSIQDPRLNRIWIEHEDDEHPIAWGMFGDHIPEDNVIACPSIRELKTWFEGWHGTLVRCGFKIRVYEVDDRYIKHGRSGKQVGFHPDSRKTVIR